MSQRPSIRIATFLAIAMISAASARAEPTRVVSLNPCLDTILVEVADREQIAALSHFSRDENTSTIADIAVTFPMTHESAEEVMSFNPDLVLASRHSSPATRNALRRVNITTELFIEPQSITESIAQVRAVAKALHRQERGEQLVARIEAAFADAAPEPDEGLLPALLYQRNGFSTGAGTLLDDVLTHTGFRNVGGQYGLTGWGNIPLEHVVAAPPQILLAADPRPGVPAWTDRIMRHPALNNLRDRMFRATFPDKLIYCGGPGLIKTAEALHAARKNALASGLVKHRLGDTP